MIVIGSYARYSVNFAVKCAGGYWKCGMVAYTDSLLEAEAITQEFYNKAAAMRRYICSSKYLFGGDFEENTIEWIICHTVNIEIFDNEDNTTISSDTIMHPYLEYIIHGI